MPDIEFICNKWYPYHICGSCPGGGAKEPGKVPPGIRIRDHPLTVPAGKQMDALRWANRDPGINSNVFSRYK